MGDISPPLATPEPVSEDGVLPALNVPEVLLQGLTSPLPVLWGLTLPFGLALALIGHPWIGLLSCLCNMSADTVAQTLYRRWRLTAGTDNAEVAERRIGVVLLLRAAIAMLAPLAAVLVRGAPVDLMFLGLMACLLISVAIAQGSLSSRLYWMSAAPPLAGLGLVAILRFPLLEASGLVLGLVMLAAMLALLGGGIGRLVGDWSELRDRNNRLIERLTAERNAAEAAREEARRASRVTSSFLATMSHEIRTPMNGVLGMAQLLKASARGGQRRQVDTLIQSGEFLMSILNDILDISRIEAGRLDIIATPQDLGLLADEVIGFWRPTAEQKGLTLTLDVPPTLPGPVVMDGRRVRQVLFNLIGNALKFTPRGGVTLRLTATPAGPDRLGLRFDIQDTGIGIDPRLLPGLFEPFAQAEESSVRMFGGAGLGLAICRQLTELMDGRLWAESAPGVGSTFSLELELPLAEPLPVAAGGVRDDAPELAEPEAARPLSVLVVDDNQVNLTVMAQILSALGHGATTATSGADALGLLASRGFDLVLMDIQMPGMTGIEAVGALRGRPGPNRDTPVLAVSADVLTHDHEAYIGLGFNGQVSKPVHIPTLMAEIAALSRTETRVAETAAVG